MRYLSMFSGIEAASVAWEPLGWKAAAFCEIEPFPSAVLAHHYPHVPNLGDVTKADFDAIGPIDLAVFGSPCQSFSVAGKRLGLDDPRGNLALYALGVVKRLRPRWFLFENVPGLLSSDEGRDFGTFLRTVGECGYQCAWRTLDAQYFGVPQRRRRVFVVGHLGDWRRAAAVLFERHSLSGNPPPRREAGQAVAGTLKACSGKSGTPNGAEEADRLIASTGDTSHCLNAGGMGRQDYETETLIAHAFDARQSDVIQYGDFTGPLDTDGHTTAVCFTAKDHGADASDISPTLRSGSHSGSHANGGVMPAVAFTQNSRSEVRHIGGDGQIVGALAADAGAQQQNYVAGSAVRRLTPRECERLMGFPDDYTAVPYRGKPAADGPRYKALGNSMAVPCMVWIGVRIAMVEAIKAERIAA